ncbi:MAG: DEAD/DEAH box helicase [Armatimonadota bacterium]
MKLFALDREQSRDFETFIREKSQLDGRYGFEPVFLPDYLFGFQRFLVEWAVEKGRAAIFADCGLGKTPMQLVWAQNVVERTNKPVLLLTPLGVAQQTVREAAKFGIPAYRSSEGKLPAGASIVISNYERLHYFNPSDFAGVVCDESSILKSFDGVTQQAVTIFMRKLPFRLLCSATAAPNDYPELGTSSEALGYLGFMDMLNKFFKNDANNSATGRKNREVIKYRFRGHAEIPFWRWVCSWARAIRRPSDIGFEDTGFILPPLVENEHLVEARQFKEGCLPFELPAIGLQEQREEKRRTIQERCERAAALVNHTGEPALVWCHLNDEGDLLERLIPGAVQVSGSDTTEEKERKLLAFTDGSARVLVTKQTIAGWGMNWQHCHHMTLFPDHSYERYYQGVRRCWRFGQQHPVTVDVVMTEGDRAIRDNMQRKAVQADEMFTRLVAEMNHVLHIDRATDFHLKEDVPLWLSTIN